MFKRKPQELVERQKVNKMLNEILQTAIVMIQIGDGWASSYVNAIPTDCILNIAQKYGFLKEKV